jgi:putative ABC transport system substrate-binding protein
VSLLNQYLSLVLFNLLLTFCASAYGEQTNKVPRVGYLSGTGSSPSGDFIGQLRDLGNVEGKNITVAFRTAQGQLNQLSEIALKMARSSVDVIFASDFNSAVASKNATQSIPIVFQTLGDPVASGLVNSLARPGRNLTGVAGFGPELSGKRLEIIREVVPGMSRIAFLTDPSNAAGAATLRETEAAAKALGVTLQVYKIANAEELKSAFAVMKTKRASALMVNHDPTLTARRDYILRLVEESRLPAIYVETQWAPSGGLISYGPNLGNQFRRAASYVDKILKGANPAELPVEQPTRFELVINLKASKQIGLTIPPNVLARADRVIR